MQILVQFINLPPRIGHSFSPKPLGYAWPDEHLAMHGPMVYEPPILLRIIKTSHAKYAD